MPSALNKYLPGGTAIYAYLASVLAILGVTGATEGRRPLAQLHWALTQLDIPAGWAAAAAAWTGDHRDVVGLVGALAFMVGLGGCGGAEALESRAGSTAALGFAAVLEAAYAPMWLLLLAVPARLSIEWFRHPRYARGDAVAISLLAMFFGGAAAVLGILALMLNKPENRPQAMRVTSLPDQIVRVRVDEADAVPSGAWSIVGMPVYEHGRPVDL
jgi:hypothetical protein